MNPKRTIGYKACPYQSYHSELALIEHFRHSKYATKNPNNASIFLVPNYSACFYNQCLSSNVTTPHMCRYQAEEYIRNILSYIEESKPYWTRNEGQDHVFVFAWDTATALFKNDPHLLTRLHNTIHLTHHAARDSIYFKPKRDISIPCHRLIEFERKDFRKTKKTIKAYFRGAILKNPQYSLEIRQKLKSMYGNAPGFFINDQHSEFYIHEMVKSKYSLCPPGWAEWSPRFYDALQLESIPVLFEKKWTLPFADIIDYSRISFVCPDIKLPKCLQEHDGYYNTYIKQVTAVKHLLDYISDGFNALDMIARDLSIRQTGSKLNK